MIANGRSSVVTEMEYAGLDTEPESAKNASVVNNRGPNQSPECSRLEGVDAIFLTIEGTWKATRRYACNPD